jgi:S-phase kinase-associated protein 1
MSQDIEMNIENENQISNLPNISLSSGRETPGLPEKMSGLDDIIEEVYQVVVQDKIYSFTKEEISLSNFIKTCIKDASDRGEEMIFKISNSGPGSGNISIEMMNIVEEYLRYHNGNITPEIIKPLSTLKMNEVKTEYEKVLDQWDVDFVMKFELKQLIRVIEAANYMDVKPMLDLCCARLAIIIKGEKIEDLEKMFNNLNMCSGKSSTEDKSSTEIKN